MAVAIHTVDTTDSPNDGRLKVNTSLTNLATDVDANTLARDGIGDVVGTTGTQTLTNKTLLSSNAGGTNTITLGREDIDGSIFRIDTDSGSKAVSINGGSITDIDFLGSNGISTSASGSVITITNDAAMVLNGASQTLTIGAAAVTAGYTLDTTGNQRLYGKLAIGNWGTTSTDVMHIKGTDNANPIASSIQNTGTGGAIIKLMESVTTSYWYMRYASGANNEFQIGYNDAGDFDTAISIDTDVNDGTLTIKTGNKIGINDSSPDYSLQISSGLGLNSDELILDPATSTSLYYAGASKAQFKSNGSTIMEVHGTYNSVGVNTTADNTYALKVDGKIYASSSITTASALTASGVASLNGGINVNSNKCRILGATGNIDTEGSLNVDGSSYLRGNTNRIYGNLTMYSGKYARIETIKAVDTTGLTIQNSSAVGTAWFNASNQLHVGAEEASVDKTFVVKGDSRFIRSSGGTSYIELSGDGSGNYIDTSDVGANQKDFNIRVAGTGAAAKKFVIQTGASTDPTALEDRLVVNGATKRVVINASSGYQTFEAHSGTAGQRPMGMDLGATETRLTWNAYYSGGWKYYTDNSSAAMYLSNSQFAMAMATTGTAGNPISWVYGLRMNENGNCSIGAGVNDSYKLFVNGVLRAGSYYSTGDMQVDDFTSNSIIVLGTGSNSIRTSGGIRADKLINTITTEEIALAAQKSASASYSARTPKLVLKTSAGTAAVEIQGITDVDAADRVEVSGSSNAYLYANEIKAGDGFYAGFQKQIDNTHTSPAWAPVQYTVYAINSGGINLKDNDFYKVVRIPKSGLYKLTYSVHGLTGQGDSVNYGYKTFAKVGSVTMAEHRKDFHYKSESANTRGTIYDTIMGMNYLNADDSVALVITSTSASERNLSTLHIISVHLEYIAASSEFNLL